jgi:transposase-like protein
MAATSHQDLVCVHCRKSFRAEALSPGTAQAGFKCPHCKLFMPLERVEPGEAAV